MLFSKATILSEMKLVEKSADGHIVEYPLDTTSIITARPGASYSLIDDSSGEIPEGTVLRREGDTLVIDVGDETVATIDDYYDAEGVEFIAPNGSETGEVVLAGGEAADVADGAIIWPMATESAGISPWIWAGGAAVLAGGTAVAIAASDDDDDDGGGTADTTAPTLESSSPVDDAADIAVDSDITLTFSEDIALGSAGTITLISDTNSSDTITIDVTSHDGQLSVTGNTLTINPGSDLADGSSYHVEISEGAIEDGAGNDYAGIDDSTSLNFVTAGDAEATDTTAPTLNSFSPVADATEVAVGNDITLTFSEDIALSDASGVKLFDASDNEVDIAVSIQNGNQLVIAPTSDLDGSTVYHVTIGDGAIEDLAGNDYAGITDATTINFTTADITAPTLTAHDFSEDADSGVTGEVAVGSDITLTFSEDIVLGSSGTISLVNDDEGTTTTIDITDSSQVSASGNTLTISSSTPFDFGDTYHVEISAGAITDASNNGFTGISDGTTVSFETDSTRNVIFDVVNGTSNEYDRTFDADVDYDIYIVVDPGREYAHCSEAWSDGGNLGSTDTITLVSNVEGEVVNVSWGDGHGVTSFEAGDTSLKWHVEDSSNISVTAASIKNSGVFVRDDNIHGVNGTEVDPRGKSTATLWTGSWASRPGANANANGFNTIHSGFSIAALTTQGLA